MQYANIFYTSINQHQTNLQFFINFFQEPEPVKIKKTSREEKETVNFEDSNNYHYHYQAKKGTEKKLKSK